MEMVTQEIRNWRVTENGSGELIVQNIGGGPFNSASVRISPNARGSNLELTTDGDFVITPSKNGLPVVSVYRR